MNHYILLLIAVFAFSFTTLLVSGDPEMLQDVCVADLNSPVIVNGFPCKSFAEVVASDFKTDALVKPGNTNNSLGSRVTGAQVTRLPGINTLGVSISRIDYAPNGLNPAHSHPRGTEIIFVLEGVLDVGFITTGDKLFHQTIKKGEVFVFPRGLIHFQVNRGHCPASVIAAFNSQNPGTQSTARTLFGTHPEIPEDVLAKGFMIDEKIVHKIKSNF